MILHLSSDEVRALLAALENYLPNLTVEAARTEDREAEHELWALRERLERLRERLLAEQMAASSVNPFPNL
jgi:hypothetical protein